MTFPIRRSKDSGAEKSHLGFVKGTKGYNDGENFDSETYLKDALSINFLQ